ncbi:PilZ domain-containing protein [Sphingomonas bacterium]|uniref:PilZ domain-containing protein n=1 Tax=Sphingomonas bacterium TaxID=1895847 RepID=UPI00157705BF|nr:PilZ domain-containing protein [Sphingomonas bacterium]
MDSIDRIPFVDHDDGSADGARSQRARGRDSLFLTGRLSLPGETVQRNVRVRNLSEGGLMIEIDRKLPLESTLRLVLRGIGEVTGRVAWCAEGRIGIALDQPIDPRLARKPIGGGEHTPHYAKPLLG